MLSPQFNLDIQPEIVVDTFAGAGGMSTGMESVLGHAVHVAINHNEDALSMHERNHPQTEHIKSDVREVCPRAVTRGRPVGALHLSPDCTHHSQAKGGQPRDEAMRALSWVAVRWAGTVRPRIITLENVREILRWGPLVAKRDPATGRVVKLDRTVAQEGERVPVREQYLVPDPKRAGQTWRRFVATLEALGYDVQTRVLCAADYGVPTLRRRLFMVARCDGAPIVWPTPTHARTPARGLKRHASAADCIDWSIPCKSIFDRKRSLADASLQRIAYGMRRFVLESGDPFLVPVKSWGGGGNEPRGVHEPLRTVTTSKRGEHALVAPVLVPVTHQGAPRAHDITEPMRTITGASRGEIALTTATLLQLGYGERDGQAPRALDITRPLGTVVAGGGKHGLCTAFLAQANGGHNATPARDAREAMSTITTTGSQQQLVVGHLLQLRNHCDGRDLREPLRTISAGGEHHALVEYHLSPEHEAGALRCAAFLMRYHGNGGQWADLREPMTTITTRDRLALVTVWLLGHPYVVVDICMRMLVPRELFNANGFPRNYEIELGHDGRLFTKTAQVRMCGNAVPPGLGAAVFGANWNSLPALRRAA